MAPGHIAGDGQCYSSPKNELFEVKHLATAGCQSMAMLRQNCHARRPRLEKIVAVCGGYNDLFFSSCSCPLFKTTFWA
jgi:hypothetical protein